MAQVLFLGRSQIGLTPGDEKGYMAASQNPLAACRFSGDSIRSESSRLRFGYELRRYSMSLPAASDVQLAAPGIYPTTYPEAAIK